MLRICAVNRAGRGAWAEQFLELAGMTTVLFCPDNPILNQGLVRWNPDKHTEVEDSHWARKYATYWEEHIFISDHQDSPKVSLPVC